MNSFPQTMKQIFILVLEFHLRTKWCMNYYKNIIFKETNSNDFIKNDNFLKNL